MPNSQWVPKAEALKRYPLGRRQLEMYMRDGRIARKTLPREPGQQHPTVLVNVEHLERYKRAKAGKDIMPPPPSALILKYAATAPVPMPAPAAPAEPRDACYTPEPRRPPRLWCTLHEASVWSGLPVGWLKRACEARTVEAIDVSMSESRASWRINREALIEAQGGFVRAVDVLEMGRR